MIWRFTFFQGARNRAALFLPAGKRDTALPDDRVIAIWKRIAHRISTIQNADRILVLEDGEAKECGNHKELMASSERHAPILI